MKKTKVIWIMGIALILANILFYWFRLGGDVVLQYVSDLLPVASSLIASISLIIAFTSFKTFDFIKISWLLLCVGIILFFLGESLYAILEIGLGMDMNESFPSIADIAWCAGYIPMLICLAMMLIGYVQSGLPLGKWLWYAVLSMIFIVVSASIVYYVLIPIMEDPESGVLAKVFSLFYPIADLFLLAPAFIIIYFTSMIGRGRLSRPWMYMAFGFFAFTVADLLYSYLSWTGAYENGNFIDVAWNAGYLLIALSAVTQSELIASVGAGVDK